MEAMAMNNFILQISSITASLSYCYFFSSKLPKGTYRFISLIPVLVLFTVLPLRCSSVFTTAVAASFITWLTNFKLIRFAFELDQSPFHHSDSLLRFITLASLPIKSKTSGSNSFKLGLQKVPNSPGDSSGLKLGLQKVPNSPQDSSGLKLGIHNVPNSPQDRSGLKLGLQKAPNPPQDRSGLKLGLQVLIFTVLVRIVMDNRINSNSTTQIRASVQFTQLVYCAMLFLLIDIVSAVINTLLLLTTGLELESSSDQPYFATSLQNFWGRWNLMVTNTLRHTVYKPVRSAFTDREWAPLAGVMASFVVSGLMHELFVYQLSREQPTWEMTLFFVIHGICVVVEMIVKRGFSGCRLRLPEFVTWLLTMGFVVTTGMWLFFPPLVKNRLDVRILQEYTSVIDFIKGKIFVLYFS